MAMQKTTVLDFIEKLQYNVVVATRIDTATQGEENDAACITRL